MGQRFYWSLSFRCGVHHQPAQLVGGLGAPLLGKVSHARASNGRGLTLTVTD